MSGESVCVFQVREIPLFPCQSTDRPRCKGYLYIGSTVNIFRVQSSGTKSQLGGGNTTQQHKSLSHSIYIYIINI